MECELCGREVSRTIKVRIEGTVLNVCRNCARLGTPLTYKKKIRKPVKREEIPEQMLDPEFAKKIISARETLKLTREDVARKARISPSYLEKIESGKFRPTIQDAKKIERVLGVSIIVQQKPEQKKPKEKKQQRPQNMRRERKIENKMTLGDIVQIKVKKSE